MTKHNLQRSLPWLLKHQHPAYDNLDHTRLAAISSSPGADDGSVRHSQEMARLQLAPQTITKPRLFTQSKQTTGLPTPGPSRPWIEKQQQQSPASCSRPPKVETPINYAAPRKPAKTPASAYADSVFDDVLDIDDVERVDLTSGDPHSSSFGDFGTPERLWDEASATRVWPLSDKRGKKRKSDEYRQDLLSPRPRQGPAKRKVDGVQASGAALDIADQWSDFEDEDNDEATQKPAQPELGDPSLVRQPSQGSQISRAKGVARDHVSSKQKRDSPSDEPKYELRDSVADSDDDDLMHALGEPEVKEDQWSQPLQRAKIEQDPQDARGPSIAQVKTTRQSTPADIHPTQQTSSLTHQNLPTPPAESDTPVPRRGCAPPTADPTTSNSRRLTSADQGIVAKYMESGTDGIKSFLARLEASKQETIDEYAEIRIRGDAVPGWLKTKKETIAARIVAANKLLELHGQYAATLKEKESCKRRMVEMLNNDEDIEGPFATHVDELAARCHAQEASIFSQLRAAGLQDMSPPSKAHSANATSSELLDHTGVLVASTQKAPLRSPQKVNQARQTRNQDNGAGSILQRALLNPPAREDSFSTERSRRRSPDNFNRIVQSPLKQPDTTTLQTHIPKQRSTNDLATNTANAAFPEENYDEFFDDDEDMLDAANAFEEGHSRKHRSQHSAHPPRAALCEMSDNVRRPATTQPPSMSKPNSALMNNPLTKDAFSALRKRFHLEGFRQNQLEAIIETMSGRDAFVLMPTGGGKSLCYQLPAILDCGRTRGVTIVVSPLLSLMQDQVDHLQKLKIQAMLINSEVTAEHKELVFEALRGPNPQRLIQLLYITPEMLTKSGKLNNALDDLFARQKLARIVIDEAHCVSQWGHDFRPDYKDIGNVRKRFRGVPAMALTATATENVKVDVMHNLGMTGCKVFTQSFNRPNLTYEVRPKAKGYLDSIAEIISDTYPGQSGIVYCLSRKDCERLAKKLSQEYGISATHYHALLIPQEKANIQKRWQSGDYQVIVATIAFGMGIDKPDVRFVIHNTIPKSLEGYYQETGRAGRDGQQSGCYLYYSFNDTNAIRRMINEGEGNAEQKERQRQMLRNVVQFCENRSDCRRSQVLAYFNERFPPDRCDGGCDNCNSNSVFQLEDFTEHARHAVELVRQLERDDVTLLHCVDVYRGAKGTTKIKTMGHDRKREYGMGKDLERGDCERLFQRLVSDDVLEEHQKTNRAGWTTGYVRLGAKVNMVARGIFQLHIQVRVSPNGKSKARPSKPMRKKAPSRDSRTGVRATVDDYPVSTNVSSPLQPRSRPPRSLMAMEKGLDPSHRHVLDLFVEQGRALVIKTMQDKDLRTRPVADVVLREIGIEFPSTKDAMLEICGMTEDKYKLIGPQLLRLARSARNDYEAIVQAQGDMPTDTNGGHIDEDEAVESESSRYFSANGDGDIDRPQDYKSRNMQPPAKSKSVKASFKKTSPRSSSASFSSRRGQGGTKGGASGRVPKAKSANSGVRKKSSTGSSRASGGRASSIIRSYGMQKSAGGRVYEDGPDDIRGEATSPRNRSSDTLWDASRLSIPPIRNANRTQSSDKRTVDAFDTVKPQLQWSHTEACIQSCRPDIVQEQFCTATNPLRPANFEDRNTPNWQLPSMSFKPLSFVQYSPSHSGRPKTSEGTPCRQPLKILSPMPSRPVSSQSRKRFSNILELEDIHGSSGKSSTSHSSKQKAAILKKVEEVPDHRQSVASEETMKLVSSISNGSLSSHRLYYDGTVDSDQRISQVTSQDKSTIESLLDRHIECLGLGPKSDSSSDESANLQDGQLDEQSSAEDMMQLSELLAKAPSWPRDRRWTSYSQQPSSLGTVERQMLRPRRLFASMDGGIPRTIAPRVTQACPSDLADQKSRRSYGWQTLTSSSELASPPPTILSSVSSDEVGDIDFDGRHPDLKVKRISNLSKSSSVSSRLSKLSAPLPRECRESGLPQRSWSELVARECRRRRRIRMMLKLKMKSRTLGNMLHADMTQHPIGDLPSEAEEKAHIGQGSSFKSPAAGYAELSAEAVPPSMYRLEHSLSKRRPVSARWSSIVVAMTDPVKRGSVDLIRQASKYSKRSQRSNASVVQPINTSRITYPLQRPRSLLKIAPPNFGPQLTTSDLNLSIPYADVPSTIRPTLRESKSCFSDDSSAHFARRSLRQKFTLHSFRHALPGSRTSVVTREMRRGENTVTLSHSCQMKGRKSLDGNTWIGYNDKVVPMSDFAYRKRRVVEKIKCWWQKQCVLKKLKPMRRKDERRAPAMMAW
ncbi:hypothetical protein DV736_g4571, partial [Chaetothyriales sp. CBS 134916]